MILSQSFVGMYQATEEIGMNFAEKREEPAAIEDWENFEPQDLFTESSWNVDPKTAFFLNEFVAIAIMTGASLQYKLSYDGEHDAFQWKMHLFVWGQTQFFWLWALIFDSELSRFLYFYSAFITAFVPYVGVPIYLLWVMYFHLSSNDGVYPFTYVIATIVAWLIYGVLMRYYSINILTSINNYALIPVGDRLIVVWEERRSEAMKTEEEDETNSFDSGEKNDGVLDEWIFI